MLFALGLGAAILLSNREVQGPDGVPLINNGQHYNEVLQEADTLVRKPFETADAGGDLTDEDRKNLRQAVKLFDAMNAFQPRKLGPYLGAGKAYALLGEYDLAETRLRQLISNVPIYEDNDAGRRAALEAKYVLSQIRFRQGKMQEAYDLADEVVKVIPDAPNYLIARASAAIELRKLDQAKADVANTLQLDPGHPRAKQLATLLKTAK